MSERLSRRENRKESCVYKKKETSIMQKERQGGNTRNFFRRRPIMVFAHGPWA
jgi:hypothetical protein